MKLDSILKVFYTNKAYIASTEKSQFELATLPSLFSASPWTVYLDDVPHLDTRGQSCTEKWLETSEPRTVSILNVRPDGYVGSVSQWETAVSGSAEKAATWLETYYGAFLSA